VFGNSNLFHIWFPQMTWMLRKCQTNAAQRRKSYNRTVQKKSINSTRSLLVGLENKGICWEASCPKTLVSGFKNQGAIAMEQLTAS
jgi:hypothetical protein